MFKNLSDYQSELAEITAKMTALVEVAKDESRELSDEEAAEVDALEASIPALEAKIERAKKIAARTEELLKHKENEIANGDIPAGDGVPSNQIVVPARAKSSGRLEAFDDERDAYVAGHAILGGLFGSQASRDWLNANGFRNTLVTNDNNQAGFLTTEEMQRSMVRLREDRGVFTRNARRYPMGADIVQIPRDLADVTASWVGEGVEITASDVTVGNAELMAKKLASLSKYSTEIDEDSVVDVAEMITKSMAYRMADKIDEAAFNGDGTSTYGGVLGLNSALHANAVQTAATGNDSALTLDLADFEAAVGKYPQYPGASPKWYVHSAVYWASMARLMDAGGGNRVQDLGSGPVMSFLGYPVEFTQVLPSTTGTLASTIVAYFGDLGLSSTYGVRRSVRTQVSVDRYFENDLIGIKCTERVGILNHERGDTIRTRPMIALKTAS